MNFMKNKAALAMHAGCPRSFNELLCPTRVIEWFAQTFLLSQESQNFVIFRISEMFLFVQFCQNDIEFNPQSRVDLKESDTIKTRV